MLTPLRLLLRAGLLLPALAFASDKPPNFLIIVADDMGYSDIGALGSEIRTPTLDGLAASGLFMNRFYTAPTCSPTRAMLMTGVDNHLAGVGTMEGVQTPQQLQSRNYDAQLHDDVVTLAEGLKTAGYATLMSGKWHIAKDKTQYPHSRGFDRSFVLGEGGASHFADATPLFRRRSVTYLEDGKPAELPEDFYSTRAYTDKMLAYLQSVNADTPVLAYVAYTAPHDPLQVPDDWMDRYQGAYDAGPAAIRAQRVAALQAQGLFPDAAASWQVPKFPAFLPTHFKPWASRTAEERAEGSKPMEIYAAMVEYMDAQIQRLLDELERSGRLDNTYVIFLSDNGPNGATPLSYPNNSRDWFRDFYDLTPAAQGRRGSHTYLGREWAWATAAPFRLYKGAVTEGGIRSPLIVRGPGIPSKSRSGQLAYITDLPATLYELAGVAPEDAFIFRGKLMPEGRSLAQNWRDPAFSASREFAMELFGMRAAISDNWKATNLGPPVGSGHWALYDIAADPGEMDDLADTHPEQLQRLISQYESYKTRSGVIPPQPPVEISFGDLFTGECNWACEMTVSFADLIISLWQRIAPTES